MSRKRPAIWMCGGSAPSLCQSRAPTKARGGCEREFEGVRNFAGGVPLECREPGIWFSRFAAQTNVYDREKARMGLIRVGFLGLLGFETASPGFCDRGWAFPR